MPRDEHYVIDLCDMILGCAASRQHRFSFLLSDAGRNGVRRRLPVDAYYANLSLVIEYRERQHTEAVPIMDLRPTVSGCTRGEQRRIYDERRRTMLPANGLRLIEVCYRSFEHDGRKRLRRTPADRDVVRGILREFVGR